MKTFRRSSPSAIRETFVYLAFAPSKTGVFVKIGMSGDPIRRVRELRSPDGSAIVSLYESSRPAPDIALGYEVEHDILGESFIDGNSGEWRFLPSDRPWLMDGIFESADKFIKQSIHPEAEMRRVAINFPACTAYGTLLSAIGQF